MEVETFYPLKRRNAWTLERVQVLTPLRNFPPYRGFGLRSFTNPNDEVSVFPPTKPRNGISRVDQ
jgi:hypothetical protein